MNLATSRAVGETFLVRRPEGKCRGKKMKVFLFLFLFLKRDKIIQTGYSKWFL